MTDTPVRAAAEGMSAINRRTALALAGAGAVSLISADAIAGSPSKLSELIENHKAAYAEFLVWCDKSEEAHNEYFGKRGNEIVVPLSIGGGQSCYLDDRQAYRDHSIEDTCKAIKARYAGAVAHLRPLEKVDPELAAGAKAKLKRALKSDLRGLLKAVREEDARRMAAGFTQVNDAYYAASDAEQDTLIAVCGYRCASTEELREKGDYLLPLTGPRYDAMQPEMVLALVESMASEAQS